MMERQSPFQQVLRTSLASEFLIILGKSIELYSTSERLKIFFQGLIDKAVNFNLRLVSGLKSK